MAESSSPPLQDVATACFDVDQAVWRLMSSGRVANTERRGITSHSSQVDDDAEIGAGHGSRVFLDLDSLTELLSDTTLALLPILAGQRGLTPAPGIAVASQFVRVDLLHFVRPFTFALRFVTSGKQNRPSVEYWVRQCIRNRYMLEMRPHSVRLFRGLCEELNDCLNGPALPDNQGEQNPDADSHTPRLRRDGNAPSDVVNLLRNTVLTQKLLLTSGEGVGPQLDQAVDGFIQCCRNAGALRIERDGTISFFTKQFDFQYLLSMVFGFPSGITGFDDLFGGGGLFLNDSVTHGSLGRSVLIRGRFGTGKSLLSLQIAASVAKRGGVAWVTAFEQTPEECLLALESAAALPEASEADVLTSSSKVRGYVPSGSRRGLLIITGGANEDISFVLNGLRDDVNLLMPSGFALRLLCVDPLSSVPLHEGKGSAEERRGELYAAMVALRRNGTNILMISDDDSSTKAGLWLEENICDTVIRTGEKEDAAYLRRVIEIQKSRLQRESRGRHVYEILSGRGVCIYPSTASVDAKIINRRVLDPSRQRRILFGIRSLDETLLKDSPLIRGDVVALRGDTGSLKTQMGLVFLSLRDKESFTSSTSLLLAARESVEALRFQLNEPWYEATTDGLRQLGLPVKSSKDDFLIHSLPLGHILPGQIFQFLEQWFDEAVLRGKPIDRVMITNIAHWEMSCPFMREDFTFGDTLVNFLRRRGVSSVFVCGREGNQSNVQRPIVDYADCVLEFGRSEDKVSAERAVTIRVVKSRRMLHDRREHEMQLTSEGLRVVVATVSKE